MTHHRQLLAGLLAAVAVSGCAGTRAHRSPQSAVVVRERPVVSAAAAPAVAQRVAIAYLTAARNTTPATMRRAWQHQIALAAPALARALAAHTPSAADVDQARIDNHTTTSRVIARASMRLPEGRAVVVLTAVETTGDQHVVTHATTTARLTLTRHRRRWQVAAFTVLPGTPDPQDVITRETRRAAR